MTQQTENACHGTGRITTIIHAKSDGHFYIFRFLPETRMDCHQAFGRWAADPELGFDFADASAMTDALNKWAGKQHE